MAETQVEGRASKDAGKETFALEKNASLNIQVVDMACNSNAFAVGNDTAQKTVDQQFPKHDLEDGTLFSRLKDPKREGKVQDAQFLAPDNLFPFTDAFKNAAPLERFNKDGYTPDLEKDLLQLTLSAINSAGDKGGFGTRDEQWQDCRTAIKIAGVAGKLPEFVKGLNDGLAKSQFSGKLKIESTIAPAYKPLLGNGYDETLIVKITGGSGDWRKQTQAFASKIEPTHTEDYARKNLAEKYNKYGWSAELSREISSTVVDRIDATTAIAGHFGKNGAELRDIAHALSIARNAGENRFEDVIKVVNEFEKGHGRPLLELKHVPDTSWNPFVTPNPHTKLQIIGGIGQRSSLNFYDRKR